jgi:hypothetical protein
MTREQAGTFNTAILPKTTHNIPDACSSRNMDPTVRRDTAIHARTTFHSSGLKTISAWTVAGGGNEAQSRTVGESEITLDEFAKTGESRRVH